MEQLNRQAIITDARYYRLKGWNVLPTYNFTKAPFGADKNIPWTPYKTRPLTDEEFEKYFNVPQLSGVGLVCGRSSGVIVIDQDSYKEQSRSFDVYTPLVSNSARGGKHLFFKYTEELSRSIGEKEGLGVRSNGNFTVLPPSLTTDGKYTWASDKKVDIMKLPTLTPEQVLKYYPKHGDRINISERLNVPLGQQHISLLEATNSILNKWPQNQWESEAYPFIRSVAAGYEPPHPLDRVEKMIRDCSDFIRNNPKIPMVSENSNTVGKLSLRNDNQPTKTDPVYYTKTELTMPTPRRTINCGLRQIDAKFSFPSGYAVILGNPGSGKGWWALWSSKQFFTLHGLKTVYFSLEMTEPTIRARILQAWSNLTQKQYESNADTTPAEKLMKQDAIVVYPFGFDDTGYQTPENFKRDFEDFYQQGYRVFHFDHFHELSGMNDNERNLKVAEEWALAFRDAVKEHDDVWLFVYAQPNGAAARKKILRREDISGSKVITHKCDLFISINRSIKESKTGEIEIDANNRGIILWVDKNRHGSNAYFGIETSLSLTGNFTNNLDEDVQQGAVLRKEPLPRQIETIQIAPRRQILDIDSHSVPTGPAFLTREEVYGHEDVSNTIVANKQQYTKANNYGEGKEEPF